MHNDFIRHTVGTVVKYDRGRGYGWIKLSCDRWRDAFVSYRSIEPDKKGLKKLEIGELVKLDLTQNNKGYEATNVYPITEEYYNNFINNIFNR